MPPSIPSRARSRCCARGAERRAERQGHPQLEQENKDTHSSSGTPLSARKTRVSAKASLPGLSDLMMVGQWTAPFTGTVIAALTGRQAIELLCHRDGIPFQATVPA
jgi:hypothetical protein